MTRPRALIPALALLMLAPTAALAQDASLTLTFETGADTGAIMVALFDRQAAYEGGGAPVRQARVDVAAGERLARFDGLPDGDYAARAFHDVNGDGRLNTNPFGLPTEPFAFTNNAVGNMGPASWERARVHVTGPTSQTLRIR